MINFPDTPTLAQIFTTVGSSWQWDGSKWEGATVASGSPYLPLTGGTLTGQLTVNPNIVIGNPVTSPPATSLVINKAASTPQASTTPLIWAASEAGGNGVLIDIYSPSASANLTARKARGTAAAPTAVQAADTLSNIITTGYGASAYGNATTLAVKASENWSNTAQGSFFAFSTNTPGTTTIVQRATINQGVVIGNPANDPGQGGLTLNANAAAPPPSISVGAGLQLMGADTFPGYIDMVGIGAGPTVFARRANGTGAAPTAVQAGQTIAGFQARGYGATAWSGNRGNIQFVSTENWTDAAQGAALAFVTGANGTTTVAEAMRIDHSGNVGIGTTVPNAKVHIAGTAATPLSAINVTGSTTAQAYTQMSNTGGTLVYGLESSAGASASVGSTAYAAIFGTQAATPLQLLSNNTVRMTIDNAGNVGIGTTAPQNKLDVNGGIIARVASNPAISIDSVVGSYRFMRYLTSGSPRWDVVVNNTAEGGSNAGSDFYISRYSDAGVGLGVALQITRSNGACANTSGSWTTISDASVKQNVQPYTRGLDAIVALNPVEFRYAAGTPFAEIDKPSRQLFGLIADEVKPHVPEIVGTTTATIGKKEGVELATLEPGNLIYALINAVKELNAKVVAMSPPPARRKAA